MDRTSGSSDFLTNHFEIKEITNVVVLNSLKIAVCSYFSCKNISEKIYMRAISLKTTCDFESLI